MALALGLYRKTDDGLSRRVHAQLATVGHAEAQDVHVLSGPGADRLGEKGDADAHELAPLPLFGLLAAQLVVAGHLHREPHRPLVLARVVDPTGLGGVGELLGPDEVPQAELGRVHAQLESKAVDDALDQIDRLCYAERAGVGDPSRRLVGVDGCHLAVSRLKVVAPGEDSEEPGGILDWGRRAVESTMVGKHIGPDGEDLAVPCGRDLAPHDVVAGKACADEVL